MIMLQTEFREGIERTFWILVVGAFCLASSLVQAETKEEKEKELPPSGTLSSSSSAGYGGHAVDAPWGADVISGGAPVSGSISRLGGNKWVMKVFNNSEEDKYSVDLKIVQTNNRGKQVKSDYYTYTLGPKKSAERTIRVNNSTQNCSLQLQSWKKIGGKKKKKEEAPAAAGTGKAPAEEVGG